MEPLRFPAWMLPVSEKCSEARELRIGNPTLVGNERRQDWREALQTGILALTDSEKAANYLGLHKAILGSLSKGLALSVSEAVSDHVEEVRKGMIPAAYRFAAPLELDVNGNWPPRSPVGFWAQPDCLWNETTAKGETTAVVLSHDLAASSGKPTDWPWPSLEDLAVGLAWAVMNDVERVRVGRCIHTVNKPPRYEWTPSLVDSDMQVILGRVRRALTATRTANTGTHCFRCPAARLCTAWQLPALAEGQNALKATMKHGEGITAQNVENVRRVALAMDNAACTALFQVREYELRAGIANDNAIDVDRYLPILAGGARRAP